MLMPHSHGWGMDDLTKTQPSPIYVTTLNLVALGQTIWA